MLQQALEILKKARARISNPASWIKARAASKADGTVCNASHEEATHWCAYGALMAETPIPPYENITLRCPEIIVKELGITLTTSFPGREPHSNSISVFNDAKETTHQDILNMFDITITRLEAQLQQEQLNDTITATSTGERASPTI